MAVLEKVVSQLSLNPQSEEYLTLDLPGLFALPPGGLTKAQLEGHSNALRSALNKSNRLKSASALGKLLDFLRNRELFTDPDFWADFQSRRAADQQRRLMSAVSDLESETPLRTLSRGQALRRLAALGLDGLDPSLLSQHGFAVFDDLRPPVEGELSRLRSTWGPVRDKHGSDYPTVFHLMVLGRQNPPVKARCVDELSVGGKPVTSTDIEQSHAQALRTRDSNAVQDAAKFLAELKRVRDPETLRRVAFATVWERAKQQLSQGIPSVRVAKGLCSSGLDELDAVRIVAAVAEAGNGPGNSGVGVEAVREALAQGKNERARRTLEALKEDPQTVEERRELATRIEERARDKARALSDYESAMTREDYAQARSRLQDALQIDADDSAVEELLVSLPLPAPRPTLRPTESGVLVEWNGVGEGAHYDVYRSVNGVASTQARLAESLAELAFTDAEAPVGEQLRYAVVAARPGGISSAEGHADIVHLPVPKAVSAKARASDILVSWVVPPQTNGVKVRTLTLDAPPETTHVQDSTTFHMSGADIGRMYRFEVSAVYLTSGGPQESPAVTATATPRGEVRPVTDLTVTAAGSGPGLEARWSQSRGAVTELWAMPISAGQPPAVGTVLTSSEASASGLFPLRSTILAPGDHHMTARLHTLEGPHVVVPLTCGESGFLVGVATVAGNAPPVAHAAAERFGDRVRLTWTWPGGNYDALVRWRSGAAEEQVRVTKSSYGQHGAVYLPNAAEVSQIGVITMARTNSAPWVSQRVDVPFASYTGPVITYTSRIAKSLLGRARVELTVTGAHGTGSHDVGVYFASGTTMPARANQARHISTLTVDCSRGASQHHTVDLGRVRGPFWIRLFCDDGRVTVRDPKTSSLKG
ncbi:tetratricopeptide repeat protein [Kocuria tytonis]|uniref:Tetratricopeptide repeat protein n=2 Tax=Kocuria tytonis TaxID=2054280 RepID=A0A495ADA1_9MICC|nr:tetratricopeptide repeat protein [Kocuria tytonis]